jgi:hypothetical protein
MYIKDSSAVKAETTSTPKKAPRRRRTEDQRRRTLQAIRIGDLHQVFGHRYGGGKLYQFPDDDAGRDDLQILLQHYAHANPLAIHRVVKARAPWLTDVEQDSLFDQTNRFARRWTAQALATALNIVEADRRLLGIRTIGSVDMSKEQRRKLRDRDRKRKARRAKGAKPHEQSKSRTKPWLADGISPRTWYRRQAEMSGTDSSAIKRVLKAADEFVPRSKRQCPKSVCSKDISRVMAAA